MLNHFIKFEVYYVGREGNAAAHVLARHAQYVNDMVVWWHSTIVLIKQYVSVDAMLNSQKNSSKYSYKGKVHSLDFI